MTAQQLKNSILQMAVQGKLVPQDPNDEPASVLLERIRAEKEQLIKEKKIKKEKNPSVIFRGADNLPYEKVGKNEPVCIADEVPFEIPDTWEWARLKNLVIKEIKRGKSPKYAADGSVYVFAQKCNVKLGGIDISLAKFLDMRVFEKYPVEEYMVDEDIIINSTGNGTLGRIGMFRDSDRINDFIIVPDSHVTIIRACNQLKKDYLFYVLKYYQPFLEKLGEGSTNQTELRPSTIAELFIPIPPIKEQEQIVAKLLEVIPMVDLYGKKENSLQAYNTDFPTRLKKSILQEAVQGKLVPQDPADEPASVLLERIRAEKEQLIKAGKLKRDKHESIIFRRDNSHYEKRGSEEVCIDDEIPFEIPEKWTWARLSSFGIFSSGKTPSMSNPQFWNGDIPWVTSKDMKQPVITDSEMHITELAASTMQLYPEGTLLLVARSGILKRLLPLCVLGIDSTINQDIKAFKLYDIDLSEWLYYGIKAFEPYILKELVKSVTTVESLKFDEFSAMLIPVPPLAEQHRIISAIKAVLSLLAPLSSNPLFSL